MAKAAKEAETKRLNLIKEHEEHVKKLNVDGLKQEQENLKKALDQQKTEFEKIQK
jgi:hypothetical protein